jgi:hypothetical protein
LIESFISTPVANAAARANFTPIEAATEITKVAFSPKLFTRLQAIPNSLEFDEEEWLEETDFFKSKWNNAGVVEYAGIR